MPAVVARSRRAKEAVLGYSLLAPLLLIFAAFAYYPFYRIIHFALYQKFGNSNDESFVGLAGVWDVLRSDDFLSGLWITIKFMLYTVPAGLVLGVLMATAAHRRLRGIKIFQTIFSSTVASSVAVSSVVFLTLVNRQAGFFQNVGWLNIETPAGAMRGVALSSVWQNVGLTFIIVLAGMQAIPDEINEAATLDGYGPVRRFFRVTVPMISPTLLFLAVVLVVQALQAYAQIEILTLGGPNRSTETLLYKITRLQGRTDLQTGASMAIGLFLLTLVVSAGQFLMLNRRVHYDN
ncbi:MAG: sugar ABC transporter permease [Acidimicrobiales bacterium]